MTERKNYCPSYRPPSRSSLNSLSASPRTVNGIQLFPPKKSNTFLKNYPNQKGLKSICTPPKWRSNVAISSTNLLYSMSIHHQKETVPNVTSKPKIVSLLGSDASNSARIAPTGMKISQLFNVCCQYQHFTWKALTSAKQSEAPIIHHPSLFFLRPFKNVRDIS